ncbi:ricin-type beta-trefoil lectin domain protein [Streptomyces sp. NPDC058464]|uniref:ricin-type beta-trefoil lectin domain protein n=1 Tax=Streptomyces sp. NPDC058464 TaxID=3346511 RepID=UPI00364E0FCD
MGVQEAGEELADAVGVFGAALDRAVEVGLAGDGHGGVAGDLDGGQSVFGGGALYGVSGDVGGQCVEVGGLGGGEGGGVRAGEGDVVGEGCDGDAWQKWVFKSDGSVRSMGLCLDIANASQDNGAAIQLATCNGGWAQKFNLNSSHDLVNSVIGKCVDAKDSGTANGTRLQLWDCAGTSNQKWRLA